ncbi:uncharacterized protein At4g13230-like [Neltuma alba]|uniref:uncharacterized protein At4g13230-like n=1 Tax=Neltuma alba TaxID=207710 RepID=UPI0010A5248A|nr:uncharacterized protein At4g13230-like [Prosopis alba]XP_028792216.1 uncharacterized protein At4g13230-like [Prosopis alba]
MSLPKFGHAGAAIARTRTWNPRLFGAATPRPINQVPNSNETLSSDATGTTGATADENHDSKAYSTAPQNMKQKAREVGSEMSAKAENMGEKAKQAMQDAWDSTKNSAHRAADTVLGKAQDSAHSLKQNADSLKRSNNN